MLVILFHSWLSFLTFRPLSTTIPVGSYQRKEWRAMNEETAITLYTIFKATVFILAVVCLSIAGIGFLLKKFRGQ